VIGDWLEVADSVGRALELDGEGPSAPGRGWATRSSPRSPQGRSERTARRRRVRHRAHEAVDVRPRPTQPEPTDTIVEGSPGTCATAAAAPALVRSRSGTSTTTARGEAVGYPRLLRVWVPRGCDEEDGDPQGLNPLARENHPTQQGPGRLGALQRDIGGYEVAARPEKRAQYDRWGRENGARARMSAAQRAFRGRGGGGPGGVRPTASAAALGDVRSTSAPAADAIQRLSKACRRAAGPPPGGRRGSARAGGDDGFSMRGGDHEGPIELTRRRPANGARPLHAPTKAATCFTRSRSRPACATARHPARGQAAGRGRPSGALFLSVRLRPHPRTDDRANIEVGQRR